MLKVSRYIQIVENNFPNYLNNLVYIHGSKLPSYKQFRPYGTKKLT